jgi:hypothetical protein
MLVELTLKILLGFLKIGGWSCICINAHVDQAPEIVMACCVFHNNCQLKDYHRPQEVFKKIYFVVQGGKCLFLWRSSRLTMWRSSAYCTLHKLDDYLHQPHLMFFMSTLEI